MGKYDLPLDLHGGMSASSMGGAVVVAADEHIAALRAEGPLRGCEDARLVAMPATAPLPDSLLANADVIVLEVDPAADASLQRLASLRVERPDLGIVVALRDASVALVRTLIRQGVADVAQLPFQPDALAAQILDALSARTDTSGDAGLAPMIAVVGANGGSGATTVVTHFAQALARHNRGARGVCLIDLDLQGGDVSSYLGTEPKTAMDDLLEAGSRLDGELFRSAVTETRYGFSIVAAPDTIKPMDRVDTDHLLALLRLARSMFDYVLVDLPPVWTSWSLSTIGAAERVVMVADPAINSLRQAKRRLRLFREIDYPADKIDIVVNRMERKLFKPVSGGDIADVLGCDVVAVLPFEGGLVPAAQDQGTLVTDGGAKTRFGTQIGALAGVVADRLKG